MSITSFPELLVEGEDNGLVRTTRLLRAFDVMSAIARVVWPGDGTRHDPDAVAWSKAVRRCHERDEQLSVTWCDEDHLDKFRLVAEIAWAGLCESGRPVIHLNEDPDGLAPEPAEELF
jgi:hypothetical protein